MLTHTASPLPSAPAKTARLWPATALSTALSTVLACAWLGLAGPAAGQTPSPAQAASTKPSQAKPAAQTRRAKAARQAADAKLIKGVGPAYATRPEAMAFADELAERRGLPRDWVRGALGQARLVPAVVQLMQPPPTPFVKNWRVYRSRFIDEVRINAGVKFWQTHQAALTRAEQTYGVPAQLIVGIIGVETLYGRNMGSFKVINALSTLAFDFPASHPRAAERSEFFKREVDAFLTRQHQQGLDPQAPLGSYAGAMGLPQFMPSSLNNFAVDFDGDDRIDLTGNPVDAIGSVANYFKSFGWQPGMATHYPVRLDSATLDMDTLMAPDILPTFPVARFTAKGAMLEGAALNHTGPLALVELLNGPDAPSYVAGTENFYVITRYNWSSYYAMAVIELAEAVAREIKSKP